MTREQRTQEQQPENRQPAEQQTQDQLAPVAARKPEPENAPSAAFSRATFIRLGALGAAAAALAPGLGAFPSRALAEGVGGTNGVVVPRANTSASPGDVPQPSVPGAPGPVLAPNRSGGIPEGPRSYGFVAQDLLSWRPGQDWRDKHFICHIPRAPRIKAHAGTQAHPNLDPRVKLLTIDGDYRASIYDERARAIGDEDYVYTFRYWPYVDIFSSWHGQLVPQVSEAQVVDRDASGRIYGVLELPNAGWVEAAHKNGAMALGCWFWPRSEVDFTAFLVRDSDGSFPVADKLIEIRRYFGFDGYFLNQEASLSASVAATLKEFIAYWKAKDSDGYLQWYDAMLESGELDYQNMINEKNVGWLGSPEKPLCDSIFMNYGWLRGWDANGAPNGPDPDLTRSAATVTGHGFDPYQAAYGTTEFQQGGFNPSELFTDLAKPGTSAPVSWGTFVIDELWNRGMSDGTVRTVAGRSEYRLAEQQMWSGPRGNPARSGRLREPTMPFRENIWNADGFDGIANAIVEKSAYAQLPIRNTFNIGVGQGFSIAGVRVSEVSWNNAGIADPSLTWQYWVEDRRGALNVELSEEAAWEGAHCLALTSSGPLTSVLHLFKTELNVPAGVAQFWVRSRDEARGASTGTSHIPQLSLRLRGVRGGDYAFAHSSASALNQAGWTLLTIPFSGVKETIARISLQLNAPAGFEILLGEVNVSAAGPDPKSAPKKPENFSVRTLDGDPGVYFAWALSPDAYAYDIFAVTPDGAAPGGVRREWLGRAHRDCFYAIHHEDSTWSQHSSFELEAIGADGARSPRTGARGL